MTNSEMVSKLLVNQVLFKTRYIDQANIIRSKSAIETTEKGVKYVQS